MTEQANGQHSDDLLCQWLSWSVRGDDRLAVQIPKGQCTDMTGAIRVGLRLLPTVHEITVVSGDEIDIVYRRDSAGWFSDSGRWNGRRVVVEREQVCECRPR